MKQYSKRFTNYKRRRNPMENEVMLKRIRQIQRLVPEHICEPIDHHISLLC